MSARILSVVVAAILSSSALAAKKPAKPDAAATLEARDTAHVLRDRWEWGVGVFNPLVLGLGNDLEVRTHPILFFVAPNGVLRVQHLEANGWTLTGEYGLSVPTLVFQLTRGYLFPTDQPIGLMVVPSAGVVASLGEPREAVWTVSSEVAFGLGQANLTTLGTYAPLEVTLAPALGGFRWQAGIAHDRPLTSWLRGRAYADLYAYRDELGPQLSWRVGAAVDLAVFSRGRFTLGAVWWNSNQYARDPQTSRRVRSNDVYPTLDFIWGL